MTRECRLHHDRHRHGRSNRRRVRGSARHDEHESGDRRALHHGHLPDGILVLRGCSRLIAMMPLLPSTRTWSGSSGGAVVGLGMLGLGHTRVLRADSRGAVHVSDFLIGITKSSVFGVVVALAGCLRGMQSGRSAARSAWRDLRGGDGRSSGSSSSMGSSRSSSMSRLLTEPRAFT